LIVVNLTYTIRTFKTEKKNFHLVQKPFSRYLLKHCIQVINLNQFNPFMTNAQMRSDQIFPLTLLQVFLAWKFPLKIAGFLRVEDSFSPIKDFEL
tara:strand:+ start:584 stop:868 length:285 start_codon:yes stop_codon:yes gene_type:complete